MGIGNGIPKGGLVFGNTQSGRMLTPAQVAAQGHGVGGGPAAPHGNPHANAHAAAPPWANPLYSATTGLSPQQIYQATQGLVNAQLNPPIAAYNQQIHQNDQNTAAETKQVGGWYQGLEAEANKAYQDQQAAGAGLNGALAGIQQSATNANAASGNDQLAQFDKYGAGNGLDTSARNNLVQNIAHNNGLAQQNLAALGTFGATQAASGSTLINGFRTADAASGVQQLGRINMAGQTLDNSLQGRIAALNASRGSLTAADALKIRQQEIANRFTSAGLGLKGDAIVAANQRSAANNATSRADTAANNATSRANNSATNATSRANNLRTVTQQNIDNIRTTDAANQRAAMRAAAKGGGAANVKPLSTKDQNSRYGLIDTLMQYLVNNGGADGPGLKALQTQGLDSKGRPRPEDGLYVQAANELLKYGYITHSTAAGMYARGLRGGMYTDPRTHRTQKINVNNPPPAGETASGAVARGIINGVR